MIRELPPEDTVFAYAAMKLLRPGIGSEAEFVKQVNALQRPEGYRLIASFPDDDRQAAAVAGFRVVHFLAWGHSSTAMTCRVVPNFAARVTPRNLLDWLIAEARRLRCDQFHLDSGVGIDRQEAHRLYMNKGVRISSHHFQLDL